MDLTKEEILSKTGNGEDIFKHFIPEWQRGKNFKSHFRDEDTPSAGIYKKDENIYYKDFGNGDHLDCFEFVKRKYNLTTFPEVLHVINEELRLGLNGSQKPIENISFTYDLKEYEQDYFKEYGISMEVCKKYNVVHIDWYTGTSKEEKPYTITSKKEDFIIGYKISENYFKLYRPKTENKKFKFSYLGVKPLKYCFGYSQLPEKGEYVFIAAGEKDVLTLASHNYPAVCFSSEAASPIPEIMTDLKERFKDVVLIYDIDPEGMEKHIPNFLKKAQVKQFTLPADLYTRGIGKDVSDYFKASYTFDYTDFIQIDTFDNILKETIAQESQPFVDSRTDQEDKVTYSFFDLWNDRNEELALLIPDLMPAVGLLMLLGEDGIGKTQIARQLLLNIGFGIPEFLGQPINARYGRGMFVATEDSHQDFIKAAKKQVYGLKQFENVKPGTPIDFIEGTNFDDYKQLLTEIERLLSLSKYDVIVIDALSDLFVLINGEINSNTVARQILNPLQAIANRHQTLIIILHHASKSAMKSKRERGQILVEKNDCQGASAITQKPRTVLALSNDPAENKNYLHCVKANGLPRKFKETAFKMSFNEESLLHEVIDFAPVFETGSSSTGKKEALSPLQISPEIHSQILTEVFKKKPEFGYTELWKGIKEVFNKNFGTIGDNKAKDFVTFYKLNDYLLQNTSEKYYRKIKV